MNLYCMEAKISQGFQLGTSSSSSWIINAVPKIHNSNSISLQKNVEQQRWSHTPISSHFPTNKGRLNKSLVFKVLESESVPSSVDESTVLTNKSESIEPYLNGRCIYLVGMMGSGKTTVGKVLSEALGYSFYDCDALIEQAVGGTTVAAIFKLYGESFFRDNETEVLKKLSLMHRVVVSTGGGAVVRPINRRHMQKGVTIWLDVPLEALARRITAVGTVSRPLLHHESGDPYSNTMKRLLTLYEERGEAYASANVRVSLENIAAKLGFEDVCNITPTAIAIEVLSQIENFLKE